MTRQVGECQAKMTRQRIPGGCGDEEGHVERGQAVFSGGRDMLISLDRSWRYHARR
jgi:hypothetical protein